MHLSFASSDAVSCSSFFSVSLGMAVLSPVNLMVGNASVWVVAVSVCLYLSGVT